MSEPNAAPKSSADQNETPEDVATLYSWANLHGAKYRDFSASRAVAREEARKRVEEAQAIERQRLEEEAERQAQEEAQIAARLAAEAAEAARQAEAERLAEIARQAEAERQAILAAQEAQRLAAQQRAWQPGAPEPAVPSFEVSDIVAAQPPSYELVQDGPEDSVSSSFRAQPNDPATATAANPVAPPAAFHSQFSAQPPFSAQPIDIFLNPSPVSPDKNPYSSDSAGTGLYGQIFRPPAEPHEPPPSAYAPQYLGQRQPDSRSDLPRDPFAPANAHYLQQTPEDAHHPLESFLSSRAATSGNPLRPEYPASPQIAPASFSTTATPSATARYQPEPFLAPNYEAQPYQPQYFEPSNQQAFASQPPLRFVQSASQPQPGQFQPRQSAAPTSSYRQPQPDPYGDPVNPFRQPSFAPSGDSGRFANSQPAPASAFAQPSTTSYFDSREPITRPAWLAPEPAQSPSPAPQYRQQTDAPHPQYQQTAPAPAVQAQYSAGTMPPATPPSSNLYAPPSANPASPAQSSPAPANFAPSHVAAAAPAYAPQQLPPYPPQSEFPVNSPYPPQSLSSQPAHPVGENLIGSRERPANRWYALKSVFDPQVATEQLPIQPPARVPAIAVFSLAGGVGKTSIVAALGRALSARGERVLLVDTATFGLLPFFFGARDQRPGMLRTFNPPGVSAEAPIQLVTLDPESPSPDSSIGDHSQNPQPDRQPDPQNGQQSDWLTREVTRLSRGSSRMLIDLPTASGSTTRRILKLAPVVLVPVVPDMSSVVSVGAIESFFRHNNPGSHNQSAQQSGGQQIMPVYVLNQFDYALPLHLDVQEILREQLGDRLLPFALRRSPAVSEALAEGMTVMDYAPAANVAEDYASLAGWARTVAAPANVGHYGVRWSER